MAATRFGSVGSPTRALPAFPSRALAGGFGLVRLFAGLFLFLLDIEANYNIPGKSSDKRRKALPRWLQRFFSAPESSAKVLPSAGKQKTGS